MSDEESQVLFRTSDDTYGVPELDKSYKVDQSDALWVHLKNNTGLFTILEFILCITLSVIYVLAYNQETQTLKDPKTGEMELSQTELYTKFLIFAAVLLKTVLYLSFNISTCFIKNGGSETELARSCCWRGCTKETSNTAIKYGLYQLIPLLYFPWCIFVLYKYHTELYDHSQCTKMIVVGLMMLVVEAYCYLIFYSIFFILVAILSVMLFRVHSKHKRSLLTLRKSIKDIALVKLSGINYENDD